MALNDRLKLRSMVTAKKDGKVYIASEEVAIRAMNPDVLAMDEISSSEDMQSVFEASGCGVRLLATAHARDLDDLYSRKLYRRLMQMRIFKYCLFIENSGGNRSYRIEELKL